MATSMGPSRNVATATKGAPIPTNYGALSTLVTVFFFWGFIAAGNSVFIPFCKHYFQLDQFQSQLVDFGDWQGFGIRFNHADVNDITYSVGRAIDLYYNKKDLYNWMRSYMMGIDHSWDTSAKDYLQVYESLR